MNKVIKKGEKIEVWFGECFDEDEDITVGELLRRLNEGEYVFKGDQATAIKVNGDTLYDNSKEEWKK